MKENLPIRKNTRLHDVDYSMPGAYFITICTKNRKMLFAPTISDIVQSFKRYSTLEYIKMVKKGDAPPFEKQLWQRGFHDHIIRNKYDYEQISKYIHENPLKWQFDELYCEE